MYKLPLDFTFGEEEPTVNGKISTKEQMKEKLESINSIRDKLIFYNDNIESLSHLGMEGQVYFEWGNSDQRIKIYCGCANCRGDLNPADEQCFFELRAKEVDRIVSGITNLDTYKRKLAFLFDTKGYMPDGGLRIFANVAFKGTGNPGSAMMHAGPVVDLTPNSKEEIHTYNKFVHAEFNNKNRKGNGFSKAYCCFDFEKERERFEKAANKVKEAGNTSLLVQARISEIEEYFGFPDKVNDKHLNNGTFVYTEKRRNSASYFLSLAMGDEIDLNDKTLTTSDLLMYTMALEIHKFYVYLKKFGSNASETKKTANGKDKDKPTSLDELFRDPLIIDNCIQLLRAPNPPLINEGLQFQRNKGAFVMWYKALELKDFFKIFVPNDDDKALLLNKKFEGLNVSGSIFRADNIRAQDLKNYFEAELSVIKAESKIPNNQRFNSL